MDEPPWTTKKSTPASKKIVIQHLQIDSAKYLPDAHILHDLGADSLDVVELIIAIETEFDIEIPWSAGQHRSLSLESRGQLPRYGKLSE